MRKSTRLKYASIAKKICIILNTKQVLAVMIHLKSLMVHNFHPE